MRQPGGFRRFFFGDGVATRPLMEVSFSEKKGSPTIGTTILSFFFQTSFSWISWVTDDLTHFFLFSPQGR